ncbi:MAG: 4Fe-4S binding protein [Pseudomonadota bacterium]
MKELVVISGKGGTGKTCLTAAFSTLAKRNVICDADVDAADLHLITGPRLRERHDFQSGHTAVIDKDKCSECGLCRDLCQWDAVSGDFEVSLLECEGCGVCVYFCPENAVDFPVNTCGEWFISDTRFGPMVHARLGIAEENSGKLVSLVRQEAKKLAEKENLDLILTDGPPGVGCPVIAAIGGASAVLIVAEPSVSGRHDMERVVQLAAHFNVPTMVCVNKFDLNPDLSRRIKREAVNNRLTWLGKIPFDPIFTKAMVQGQTIFEYNTNSAAGDAVRKIWLKVNEKLGT